MSRLKALLRAAAKPFLPLLRGHEPQLVGAVVTAGTSFGAHYELHLTAYQQTVFVAIVTALVHWAVRGLVTPVAKTKSRTGTTLVNVHADHEKLADAINRGMKTATARRRRTSGAKG